MKTTNPLQRIDGLPDFEQITPEQVAPAIDALLRDAESALERAGGTDVPAQYEALSAVLDTAVERLSRAWGTVGHLNQVCDTPALRAAFNECLPRVTGFYARLGADTRLFAKYRAIDPDAEALGEPRRRALANALRDFVLAGAQLQGLARQRFLQIQDRLAEVSQRFEEHVQDATDAFAWYVDVERLDGVPDDVRAALRADATADGRDGFKLSLLAPRWLPVMQYATDRALREQLYRAFHHPSQRSGTERIRQQRTDGRVARVASGERPACCSLPTMRSCRWPPRWRARRRKCCSSCATSRHARARRRNTSSPTCASLPASSSASTN